MSVHATPTPYAPMTPTPAPPPPTGGSLDDLYDMVEQFDLICEELGIPYHLAFQSPSGKAINAHSNLYETDPGIMGDFADMFAGSLKDQYLLWQREFGEDDD